MEISFVCTKVVRNTAFHRFFPSWAAWNAELVVKGFMEKLFYQESRDWWGNCCLMCNPQRIWVITDPAGELYRSNALGAEGRWINHSWLGQDGSCHEHLGAERRVFLVWELQRGGSEEWTEVTENNLWAKELEGENDRKCRGRSCFLFTHEHGAEMLERLKIPWQLVPQAWGRSESPS